MTAKFFLILRKRKLRKQYEKYYAALTSKDKEDELQLIEDFKFSDHEIELLLRNEESKA